MEMMYQGKSKARQAQRAFVRFDELRRQGILSGAISSDEGEDLSRRPIPEPYGWIRRLELLQILLSERGLSRD